jgi:hypothetical protein
MEDQFHNSLIHEKAQDVQQPAACPNIRGFFFKQTGSTMTTNQFTVDSGDDQTYHHDDYYTGADIHTFLEVPIALTLLLTKSFS